MSTIPRSPTPVIDALLFAQVCDSEASKYGHKAAALWEAHRRMSLHDRAHDYTAVKAYLYEQLESEARMRARMAREDAASMAAA